MTSHFRSQSATAPTRSRLPLSQEGTGTGTDTDLAQVAVRRDLQHNRMFAPRLPQAVSVSWRTGMRR